MDISKQKLFVAGVKYERLVVLSETKLSASGPKQSVTAIFCMITLNTRIQGRFSLKMSIGDFPLLKQLPLHRHRTVAKLTIGQLYAMPWVYNV